MEAGGHGPGPDDLGAVTFGVTGLEEAEVIMAKFRQEDPSTRVQAVHVSTRLVEAGIEVTVEGAGIHIVSTLDPTQDPAPMYDVLQHLPDVVHTALMAFLGKVTGGRADT